MSTDLNLSKPGKFVFNSYDPNTQYGHYSMRMYRACRLVVDTGLHAFGWTREEAVNYMFTRTASTKPEIEVR
ncbi:hypothetical protein Anas_03153, partial [Armadillidium nasatum]